MAKRFSFSWLSCLLALALLTSASASRASALPTFYWHPLSTPADVEALAINLAMPSALYAGAFGNGLYRSTDNGATWFTATTGITLPMSVQNALAVHPLRPTIVYAGDYYGGGLYRSVDSGENWSLVLPSAYVRAIAASPTAPELVLAGDRYAGLYRSVDSGETWTPVSAAAGLTNSLTSVITFAPTTLETAYVGAERFVFASGDGGASWGYRGRLPSNVYALAASPLTPTTLLAGTYSHGVYLSVNEGITWTASNAGLPAGTWVTSLAFDPLTPTVAYAGTWDGQVYRSENSGATWSGLGYLGYVYALAVHPSAPGVIYAGTSNNGLFRGSTLDHITIEPISTTQYVYRLFTLTVTARDTLGFPLTGGTQAQSVRDARLAATLSAGYNGSAVLVDSAGLISTTVNLVNGVGIKAITFTQPVSNDIITATLQAEGLQAVSNAFTVDWFARIYLPLVRK